LSIFAPLSIKIPPKGTIPPTLKNTGLIKGWGLVFSVCITNVSYVESGGLRVYHIPFCFRVRPLVLCVKEWAHQRDLNDASCGTLSSYALVLMVLYYLQVRKRRMPPTLWVQIKDFAWITFLVNKVKANVVKRLSSSGGFVTTDFWRKVLCRIFDGLRKTDLTAKWDENAWILFAVGSIREFCYPCSQLAKAVRLFETLNRISVKLLAFSLLLPKDLVIMKRCFHTSSHAFLKSSCGSALMALGA